MKLAEGNVRPYERRARVLGGAAQLPMKTGQASRTAEHMAFFRALETLRPARSRLFCDPYAKLFVGPGFRRALALAKVPPFGRLVEWIADRYVPGARASGIARTRWIDEAVLAAMGKSVRQVVTLGAGFDCRTRRIAAMRAARCFEVDHPATLAARQERLRLAGKESAAHVVSVEIDFNRQKLPEALRTAGMNEQLRTLFLWEGVTNYLTAEAVDEVLTFVAGCAGGSELIFTYVDAAALDGSETFADAKGLLDGLAKIGEPWTFGLEPDRVPELLQARGLELQSDVSSSQYRAMYMGGDGRHMKGYEFYRAAIATVTGRAG